ncbi:MAG: 16S rRNA (cytidine(1402)-2'-O)-methyltransferase [Nitrospira sp.]|uniref:16S rRNA (Cytidine(1402)-2\'-O)-methyltransferase n=1 Tax=Nitrospira defluvii TaxID=330214 RepID=A0ABM8RQC6_9BACT|nr:SAM-dependent methyltransferase [Nitrospira defluvii]MCS6328505.1 16S rRNA (cytidine(1402)-2'-O)-methyltransferase [Nitrospira sp.]CAE6766037.1 16S rRNA (Cytidine(1402)-2\\'-O)-methyltransferase [Nitrospira defluvii]
MRKEQSQEKRASSRPPIGTLFLVGVPIGHPDDLTIRALATLRRVDLVATKNPLATQALLSHHGIHVPLTTYDRDNATEKTPILLDRLRRGQHLALVSDCGMPALYDPGRLLITAAAKAGLTVEVIPGPSIVAAAATLCGMDANAFVFEGRCAGGTHNFSRRLQSLQQESRPLILLPSVHALRHILTILLTTLGNRKAVLGLDLTQPGQQVLRGRVKALLTKEAIFNNASVAVLVVEGTGRRRTLGRKND